MSFHVVQHPGHRFPRSLPLATRQRASGDVGIEQHRAEPAVTVNEPVDGVALRLEHVVEAVFDQLAIAVEKLAVHVDGLVQHVAPRLVQEAREGLAKARASGRKLGRPKGSLGVSRLDGKEDEIRHFLELGVSKTAIAKITGVSRTTLYSFMTTRGLRLSR